MRAIDRRDARNRPATITVDQEGPNPLIEDEDASEYSVTQLRAWRGMVTRYALGIQAGVLTSPIDELLLKLSEDGRDAPPPGVWEEVEKVVVSMTQLIMGDAAPKSAPKIKRKRRGSRNDHGARKRDCMPPARRHTRSDPSDWRNGLSGTGQLPSSLTIKLCGQPTKPFKPS